MSLKHRRPLASLLLALLGAAALAAGCAEKPAAPAWSNPFDPANAGDDPFNLQAHPDGNSILVFWQPPDYPDIASYEVLRSTDRVDYVLAGETDDDVTQLYDYGHAPGDTNWYKVSVRNSLGLVSGVSRQVAVAAVAPPYLETAGGSALVGTRYVTLALRTDLGDLLDVAATGDFADAQTFTTTPGATLEVAWDLGEAAANGRWLHVWVRARDGATVTPSRHDSVQTDFRPDLQIVGRPATVRSRTQPLEVLRGAGVGRLRFAPSRAELPAAAWTEPDSITDDRAWYLGEVLSASPLAQWLYGEFESDFGYAVVDSLSCVPDDLADAGFVLAGGAALTGVRDVSLVSSAMATEMRFAESADLASVPWRAYADTILFTLRAYAPGDSLRIVYGEFRNDWFSAVAADSITLLQTGRAAYP